MARRDELPGDSSTATPDQIRALAERGDLSDEALPTLIALWPGTGRAGVEDVSRLAEATGRVLAAL